MFMAMTAADGRPVATIGRDVCRHQDLEFIGEGGTAAYDRRATCRRTVIDQGGRFWILRSFTRPRTAEA